MTKLKTPKKIFSGVQNLIITDTSSDSEKVYIKYKGKEYRKAPKSLHLTSLINSFKKQSFQVCQKMISKEYTTSMFDQIEDLESNFMIIIFDNSTPHVLRSREIEVNTMMAFCVCNVKQDTVYIELICSRPKTGLGKKLINYVYEYARLNNKLSVTLSSVDTAMTFYKKLGFKKSHSDTLSSISNNENTIFMKKPIEENVLLKKMTNKAISKRTRSKKSTYRSLQYSLRDKPKKTIRKKRYLRSIRT